MGSKKSGGETVVLLLAVLLTVGSFGLGALWIFDRVFRSDEAATTPGSTTPTGDRATSQPPTAVPNNGASDLPSAPVVAPGDPTTANAPLPAGTALRIVGSTSMVQINAQLAQGFGTVQPQVVTTATASSSAAGLQSLLNNQADLSGLSRPLSPQELASGLQAVAVARDAVALVVGLNNPVQALQGDRVKGIFSGNITDWREVGGAPLPIRVLNRPANSGTHQAFQELVLGGAPFGSTNNIQTLDRDATTPMLRQLGIDGIGYATYAQVANQNTVKVLAIDGRSPADPDYPFQRTLSYAYRQPPTPVVRAFLGYVQSPAGRQVLTEPTEP